jgi:hypothetical protein
MLRVRYPETFLRLFIFDGNQTDCQSSKLTTHLATLRYETPAQAPQATPHAPIRVFPLTLPAISASRRSHWWRSLR